MLKATPRIKGREVVVRPRSQSGRRTLSSPTLPELGRRSARHELGELRPREDDFERYDTLVVEAPR